MSLSYDETLAARLALPDDVRRVYDVINEGLYAEEAFSDITPDDVRIALGMSEELIGFALTVLQQHELAFVEETDVNGYPRHFLHTYAHQNGWNRKGEWIEREPDFQYAVYMAPADGTRRWEIVFSSENLKKTLAWMGVCMSRNAMNRLELCTITTKGSVIRRQRPIEPTHADQVEQWTRATEDDQ